MYSFKSSSLDKPSDKRLKLNVFSSDCFALLYSSCKLSISSANNWPFNPPGLFSNSSCFSFNSFSNAIVSSEYTLVLYASLYSSSVTVTSSRSLASTICDNAVI